MDKIDRERYHRSMGRANRRGRDARKLVTPFRWIRYKLTGDPLRAREREGLDDSLYPNMETTHSYSRVFPSHVNLISLTEKYGEDYRKT